MAGIVAEARPSQKAATILNTLSPDVFSSVEPVSTSPETTLADHAIAMASWWEAPMRVTRCRRMDLPPKVALVCDSARAPAAQQ
jgi:hypothetical protein